MSGTPSDLNPLSYTGIDPTQQPRFFKNSRAPTTNDYLDFKIGDQWLDSSTSPPNLHVLLSVANSSGTWGLLGSSINQSTITTFTPNILFGGVNVGMTYSIQKGYYIETGNFVHIDISISLTAKGTSVGATTISGLPFTVNSPIDGDYHPQFNGEYANLLMSLGAKVSGRGVSGTTSIYLFNSIAPNALLQLTDNEFTNSSEIKLSGGYFKVP